MPAPGDFCSYTKAVEHLGDRWSLVILREIFVHGSRGFNALVESLPGISRSVLARRLRKLEIMGLIAREPSARPGRSPYRMAPAGEQLVPTLLSFAAWADRWVPEDPETARYDPEVITFWLTLRTDPALHPDPPVALVFDLGGRGSVQTWMVLERGTAPSLCVEDPLLSPDRYVYVEADADALYPLSRGLRDWRSAVADRSVRLFGNPRLIEELPSWFLPVAAAVSPNHGRFLASSSTVSTSVPPAASSTSRGLVNPASAPGRPH
jgi:DNA-binding HxlR family transcriptional regulator